MPIISAVIDLRHARVALSLIAALAGPAVAGVLTYGDMDALGTGAYGASDPRAGSTLQGLAAGTSTFATTAYPHGYPFSPSADFAGTDTIYVGSSQTGAHDGYSAAVQRVNGPQTFSLDYSSLLPAGNTLLTLTLGIAADDFQAPVFGQPFSASLNGSNDSALSATLNGLSQTGPVVQFFTIGLNPLLDNATHTLTLSINEGGDGGDGWAVDFLTVGVTSQASAPVPEPDSLMLMGLGLAAFGAIRRRRA